MKTNLVLMLMLCSIYPAHAQTGLFKCAGGSPVVYQDTPCNVDHAVPALADTEKLRANAFKPESSPVLPLQRTSLVLGMSDTEVLNLKGWGRPGKITRTKVNRKWREEWIYSVSAEGHKLLLFANGKLTAINGEPDVLVPQQLVQITQ